jgi:hypothetical protein
MTTTNQETTPAQPDLSLGAVRQRVLRATLPAGVEPLGSLAAAAEARSEGSVFLLVGADELRARAGEAPLLTAARAALAESGLVLVSAHRIRWSPEDAPPGGATRLQRLDADTHELLLQAAPRDRAATVELLDARLQLVEQELEALAERQLEHALTRDAELKRAHRLEQLEQRVDADA